MGAAASSQTDQEQVCFGYWDTSTSSIHMVRLNSVQSSRSSSSSSDSDSSSSGTGQTHSEGDATSPIPHPSKQARKLSDTALLPKRFKLQRNGGYMRLKCSEVSERRLSGVELQEMESVNMPLKAAKILVGNPMKINGKKDSDSDEDCDPISPVHGQFDIVCANNRKAMDQRLPLLQSSHQRATVLSTNDTQITMVLPRKAAQLLLGDTGLERINSHRESLSSSLVDLQDGSSSKSFQKAWKKTVTSKHC